MLERIINSTPPHMLAATPAQVTFKNVPTPVYSDSLDEGYVYVLMLANVLGTTKEWKQIWGIASYFGFNQ